MTDQQEEAAASSAGASTTHGQEDLRAAGASGALWQGLAYLSGKIVVAVATIVLARLLTPREFGLVALATVFITFADVVSDAGVAQALIYLPRSAAVTRAVVLAATVSGVLLCGAGWLAAPAVAAYFGEPDVVPLVRVLSFSLLLTALSAVPECILRRDLRFRRVAGGAAVRALVVGSVSIGLAAAGYGAWALVLGSVSGAAVYLAVLVALLHERLDVRVWRARRPELRTVLAYGAPVAGGMLLAKVVADIDYVVVGRALGSEALGFYTVAFRLPEIAIINVFFVLSSVTFPLYSRARHDPERLRRGYFLSVRVQSLYGVAAGAGLAALAPVLVPVVLGDQWTPAVTVVSALAAYAAVRSLGAGAGDVYKAVGRPMLSVWVSLARLVVLVPVLVVATRWGIEGVAWAQVAASLVFAAAMQGLALRVMQGRWRDLLAAVGPSLAAGAAVLLTTGAVVHLVDADPALRLALGLAVGLLAAPAAVRLVAPRLLPELLQLRRGGTS